MIGKTISHYKIIEKLGEGGMGVVCKAEDTKLQRQVALKFLPENLTRDAEAKARLIQEARAAAALNHSNICTIYEIDESEGQLFLALEFIEGKTLRKTVISEQLSVNSVIEYAIQIAAGLQAAHEKGVIHRDIKSSNLMVTAKGQIKIMDFGLAKLAGSSFLTKEKATMGTVAYMSPEQARGRKVDQRTDLWSFGVVLYEMLSGQLPFQSDHEQVLIYAIINETPEPISDLRADTPQALEDIVNKALTKNLDKRYQHIDAMLADLQAVQGSTNLAAPIVKTPRARLGNLPVPSTPLLGREQELEALTQLLLREEVRLVTLTGPGGTGKTRLGLQAAANLNEAFTDGTFFVSLAANTDAKLVLSTIAQTFGIFENPVRSVAEGVIAYLREKNLLLLLDNFEQVVEATPVVAELLAACPQLKILVTSRSVLHLTGEHEFSVPPLATPNPKHGFTLAVLTQYAAIKLFVQRAAAVKPDFVLTPENAPAVAEICFRLDGLPLAIELAAARLKLFSPQAMLARLEKRFELLKGGARDMPARHHTLQQAIAWSYDLLRAEEKSFFRRLAVFSGGCSFEAVEAVWRAQNDLTCSALDGVAALIDKSLLRQDQTADDEPRFVMLETIREYALECLRANEDWEAARRAHADFFLALTLQAEPELTGPKQKTWLTKLEREHDNFRAVFKWVEENGEANHGLRLGGALWRFWLVRGHMLEGRERLTALLAFPGSAQRTRERAKTLNGAATIIHELGDYPAAHLLLLESLEIWRETSASSVEPLGDKKAEAAALNNLSWIAVMRCEFDTARTLSAESLILHRELGDKRGIALALNNLGWAANLQGDFKTGWSLHESGLSLRREIGDERGIAFVLTSLGWIEGMQGRYEKATSILEEAYDRLKALNDKQLMAIALSYQSNAAIVHGDLGQAKTLLEESAPLIKEVGSKWALAFYCYTSGVVAHEQGNSKLAEELLEESLSLFRALENKWGMAYVLNFHGHVKLEKNDLDCALACYKESLHLSRETGNRLGVANALLGFGRLSHTVGNQNRAARLFAAAEALHHAMGAPMPTFVQARFDHEVAAVRAALGEKKFDAEYAEGKNMATVQAIEYALKDVVGT
ncbi:protein kinase [candidate division KSB1 bacterium]|nr:protein kinase [candidate division KSB1 bacterium]